MTNIDEISRLLEEIRDELKRPLDEISFITIIEDVDGALSLLDNMEERVAESIEMLRRCNDRQAGIIRRIREIVTTVPKEWDEPPAEEE